MGLMQTNGDVHMGTNAVAIAAAQCEQGLRLIHTGCESEVACLLLLGATKALYL